MLQVSMCVCLLSITTRTLILNELNDEEKMKCMFSFGVWTLANFACDAWKRNGLCVFEFNRRTVLALSEISNGVL